MKKCIKCGVFKKESMFRVEERKRKSGGIYSYFRKECKECERLFKTTPEAKIKRYIRLDIQGKRETTITADWYSENIVNQQCVYCGLMTDSMVAERVDNVIGHTIENCVPACSMCNAIRGNRLTVDEMKLLGPIISLIQKARIE